MLEDLADVLQPFKVASTYLSSDSYPSLSALGPLLNEMKKKLVITSTTATTATDSPGIRIIKQAIANDLDKRYTASSVMMLMNKATFLDPRMKSLIHLSESEQEALLDTLTDEILLFESHVHSSTESDSEAPQPPPAKKSALQSLLGCSFSQNPDIAVTGSLIKLVRAEISRYKSAPVLALHEDPLKWWKKHSSSLSKVINYGSQILMVLLECLFSVAGSVVNSKRSSLDPENVEKLVFLHDNLLPIHLPYKRTASECNCDKCNNVLT